MTDNVKNEICVICLDEKRSPVALQCGHTFCSTCFTHYKSYQKYAWASRCPICRTTIMEKTRSVKRKASDSLDDRDARATVRPRLLSPPSTSTNVHQTIRQWAGNDSVLEEFLTLAVENDLEQGNRLDSAIDYLGTFFRERDTSVDNNNNTSNATSQQNLVPPELVEQQEERSANENENETSENDEDTTYESRREFIFYSPENEVEYENIAFGDSDSDSEGIDHEYHNYTRDTSYLNNDFEDSPIEIDSSHSNDSSNRADASTLNVATGVLVINDEDTEDELIESSTEQYIDLTSSSERQQQQEQQPQQQQQQQQQEDQHDSASETDVIMTSPVMIRDVIIID